MKLTTLLTITPTLVSAAAIAGNPAPGPPESCGTFLLRDWSLPTQPEGADLVADMQCHKLEYGSWVYWMEKNCKCFFYKADDCLNEDPPYKTAESGPYNGTSGADYYVKAFKCWKKK